MASMTEDGRSSPEIGRVFARAFATMAADPVATFGATFILAAVPQGLASLVDGGVTTTMDDPALWLFASSTGSLVSLASSALVTGALTHVAVERAQDTRVSLGQALLSALRSGLPLMLLGFLMALGIALGFTLLLVPGIILWVAWSVAAPALAAERCGILRAFGRSRELTYGARWRIFAMKLVVLVLYGLFAGVLHVGETIAFIPAAAPTHVGAGALVLAAIGKTISAGVAGTIQCSIYIEVRDWKDGPPTRHLAAIFA